MFMKLSRNLFCHFQFFEINLKNGLLCGLVGWKTWILYLSKVFFNLIHPDIIIINGDGKILGGTGPPLFSVTKNCRYNILKNN